MAFLVGNANSYEIVCRGAYLIGASAPVVVGLLFDNLDIKNRNVAKVIKIMLAVLLIYMCFSWIRDNLMPNLKSEIKKHIPDSIILRYGFKKILGRRLDLKCPKTLNEKLQWLKIYDRKPIYTTMVDKYAV